MMVHMALEDSALKNAEVRIVEKNRKNMKGLNHMNVISVMK